MSANLTYSDIETRVCNQLRIPTSNTAEVTKIKAVINEVYRDFWAKQDWWFLRKRGVINTVAKYTTDTIAVLNGSTGATLLTAPAVGLGSFAGRVLLTIGDVSDNNAVYRILSHTAGSTTITLDAAYTGADNATASFKIYQDSYSCPTDVGKLLKAKDFGRGAMVPVGMSEMMDVKIVDTAEGKPSIYTMLDYSTTGDQSTPRQLVVHPYPDATYRVEFYYKQTLNTELSGTTQPLMPDEYRQLLVYGSLARGYPIFMADTERGGYFQNLYNDTLNLIAAAHREYADDRPQFSPMETRRVNRRRRARVSLGTYFDTHPNEPW